jgi:hypothetical protein
MDPRKAITEIRWSSSRQHYDVRRDGVIVQLHEMKGRALAGTRKIAQDLLGIGRLAEIALIEADGFHVKEGFRGQSDRAIGQLPKV